MAVERQDSPRLVEVTVEWHSDGRRLSAAFGAGARRVLTLLAVAVIVAVGALVIAESPSTSSGGTPAVLVAHHLKLRCEHSVVPRVFMNVPSRYAALSVHVAKCP